MATDKRTMLVDGYRASRDKENSVEYGFQPSASESKPVAVTVPLKLPKTTSAVQTSKKK